MTTISIDNLILVGVHGATAKELCRSQPFRVDIEVDMESPRDALDRIESTLDYRLMKKAAEVVVCGETHTLLETVAARIAVAIKHDPRAKRVKVKVHKLTIWKSGIPGVTVEL